MPLALQKTFRKNTDDFLRKVGLLFHFFGRQKKEKEAERPLHTDYGGLIGRYGLSGWYDELPAEEQALLRAANQQGIGLDADNLTDGDAGCTQTRSGWLNVMASNLQSRNPALAEKVLARSLADHEPIDVYFALGTQAQVLWRQKKRDEAVAMATRQLDWYRDQANRNALRQVLGCLPRAILGLDVLISASDSEQALKLIREFVPLLHPDNDYKKRIPSLQTRMLRVKADAALAAGKKKEAIALYREALQKNPHAGVKGILKRLGG